MAKIKKEKQNNIAKTIREIVENKIFIKEAINKDIVNYSALAEYLKKDIKNKLNLEKDIPKETIVAALIRYTKNLELKTDISNEILETVSNISFSVKTNIKLLTIEKKEMQKNDFLKIYEKFDVENEEILIVFQGIKDLIFVTDESNYDFLMNYFGKRLQLLQENLAIFVIHSENIPQQIPGYLNFFTTKLAENNINIEIYSSKEDLTLLIEEKDVSRVFDILNSSKENAKKLCK